MYQFESTQQLLEAILNHGGNGEKKSKYPLFLGDKGQVTEMVTDYFVPKVKEKKGLGDETINLFYSLEFNLAQITAQGAFIDMLSPFYLVACIHNFTDSLVNEKVGDVTKLEKQYKEEMEAMGLRLNQGLEHIKGIYEVKNKQLEYNIMLNKASYYDKLLKKLDESTYEQHMARYGGSVDMFG